MCIPGKVLLNNTCVPFMKFTDDIHYIVAVYFSVMIQNHTSPNPVIDYLRFMQVEISHYIMGKIEYDKTFHGLNYIISNAPCLKITDNFSGYVYKQIHLGNGNVNRFFVERKLSNLLKSSFNLNGNSGEIDGILNVSFEKSSEAFDVPVFVDSAFKAGKCMVQNLVIDRLGDSLISYRIDELLHCPQVEFGRKEYIEKDGRNILVNGNGFGPYEYIKVKDNVRICSERYKKGISYSEDKNITTSSFVLQLFCSMVSLVCLISTFIIYSLFRSLRTIPGLNNMMLVFCLILNDIFFVVRLLDVTSGLMCKVIGILYHYFFLSIFTSFNVCTYHVYRVFTANLSIKINTKVSVFYKYFVFTFGIPAIIVACNIFVTLFIERAETVGYGGPMCFIVYRTAAISALLLPIGLILLSNLLMFSLALCHICNGPEISDINSTRQKRNDIIIYFKLFTITGCSWILQLIDSFFQESFFSLLISICNMLTGVFIFISYICNKRVIYLCINTRHSEGRGTSKKHEARVSTVILDST